MRRLRLEPWRIVAPSLVVMPICPSVTVETPVVVDGRRRTSKRISMIRVDDFQCRASGSGIKVGQWATRREAIDVLVKWRITDAGLAVDVIIGSKVAYDDARRIILAIHRRTWVNTTVRTPTTPWSEPDASRIEWVIRDRSGSGNYEFGFAPGRDSADRWSVRLTESAVEVLSYVTEVY